MQDSLVIVLLIIKVKKHILVKTLELNFLLNQKNTKIKPKNAKTIGDLFINKY